MGDGTLKCDALKDRQISDLIKSDSVLHSNAILDPGMQLKVRQILLLYTFTYRMTETMPGGVVLILTSFPVISKN